MFLVAGVVASCEEKVVDTSTVHNTIIGKWKLVGIVDTETDTLKVLEPKDCKECFTLTFNTDYVATVRSINMETITLDLLNLKPDINLDDSLWWELYDKDGQMYSDGDQYRRLIYTTKSYSATSTELKLFSKTLF